MLGIGCLLLGLALVALSVLLAASSQRGRTLDSADRGLASVAQAETQALDEYFGRARSVILLMAQNPAIQGLREGRGRSIDRQRHDANAALDYLERLYVDSIGEACVIDVRGVELARVVDGVWAKHSDLSHEEAGNAFFGASFKLPAGRVHQALPYVSPDTNEWVISNSTRLPGRSGAARAIVHFEVTIDSFRRAAGRVGRGVVTRVVDPTLGRVVFDSRRPQGRGGSLGYKASPALLAAVARTGPARRDALASVGGQRVAVRSLSRTPGNLNRWHVVVSAPASAAAAGWAPDTSTVLLLLGSLAFFTVGLVTFRAYARVLRRAALTDDLTGLPNRTLLLDRAQTAVHDARRSGLNVAMFILDLNRFKEINDTLGHDEGDRLLLEVAKRLTGAMRAGDTVARLGGDEFAILAVGLSDPLESIQLAERIDFLLTRPAALSGIEVDVTGSMGIALYPDHGDDVTILLKRADIAMYEAKRSRLPYSVYETDSDPYAAERLALVAELRRSIEREELFLHYQPKFELGTGRLCGVEALARWEHPVRGLVPPDEFIPVAEHTGLIRPLTDLVLSKALRQVAVWRDAGHHIPVSVNLSARSLFDNDLPRRVGEALARHGVSADLLALEITESAVIDDPNRAMSILRDLDAMDIRLAIDDFGTGYSSLAYLKQIPVAELKIDRSFVISMMGSVEDSAIVRSAIDLGHNLGLAVVAEGVEDEATLDELARLTCDTAQGYFLARPQTSDMIDVLLAESAEANLS